MSTNEKLMAQVVKVLNNNVIIALHPERGEVVIIGKGIGFNRKQGERISLHTIEKMFILTKQADQEQYRQLLHQVDELLIEVMNDVIYYISQHAGAPLNEHIHIALTDHISLAIKRKRQGVEVHNPFQLETKGFYPKEYALAEHCIAEINRRMNIDLPADEVGFVTLHICSAITNRNVKEVKEHARIIAMIVEMIEENLEMDIKKDMMTYSQLVRHLNFTLERVSRGKRLEHVPRLSSMLEEEYPDIYSLAMKLMLVMKKQLNKPVYEAEAIYLTIHLQRLIENHKKYCQVE